MKPTIDSRNLKHRAGYSAMLETHPIVQRKGTTDDGVVGFAQVLLVASIVIVGISWLLAKSDFVTPALWVLWLSGWLLALLGCLPLKRVLGRLFVFRSKGLHYFGGGVLATGCLIGAVSLPLYFHNALSRLASKSVLDAVLDSPSAFQSSADVQRSVAETKRKIDQLRQRKDSLRKLLEQTQQERDTQVKILRDMGITSSSDLSKNKDAKRHADALRKSATDVEKIQRDLARFDLAITQANAVLRRLERADAVQVGGIERELADFTRQTMELDELLDGEFTVIDDPLQESDLLDRELQRSSTK